MNVKNILVLFPCDDRTRQHVVDAVGDRGRVTFVEPGQDYSAYLPDAHIILGEPRNEDFPHCRQLELLQSPCSGVNYYVGGGTFPEKAILCSATGCYGNLIAEHMLAMTLALCRRLPEYQEQQRAHRWQLLKYDKPLEGSTVLILGAGDIGTTLAKFLRPMVGKIIGLRRTVREYPNCFDEMITLSRLEERLPEADIIVCALPHTPETIGLLNGERLRKTKPDAVLVNGGRGSLIDQEALGVLLGEGHFWGVGLEVTSPEPLPENHPLWSSPRCLITPHAAGNTFAPDSPLVRKIWDFMLQNLVSYLEGRPLQSRVDFSLGYSK